MRYMSKGVWYLLLSLLLVGLLAVPAFALEAEPVADPSPAPTIQSDKDDYPPGGTVILSGGNWQPGESVHIYVNDDEGKTWERNVDVVADDNGDIRDEFQLPDWFVATYKVTATGAQSGVATTSFTDGNIAVTSSPVATGANEVQFVLKYTIHKGATQSAEDNTCTVGGLDDPQQTQTVGSTTSGGGKNAFSAGVSANHSVRLEAAQNAHQPSGWTFKEWTGPTNSFVVMDNNPRIICATGNFTGTRDLRAVYQPNQAPVANNDAYNVNEDNTLNVAAPGVLGNDSDANNNTLKAVKVSDPANGSVTLNDNGSFTYTPNANFNGNDSFTYKANDTRLDSNVATVSIRVDAVNDAPINTVPGDQGVDEDGALTFNGANNNAISASDVDAGNGPVKVTLGVEHGKLTLGGTAGITFAAGSNDNAASMTFEGKLSDVNAALGGLRYAPNANYNGADTLTIVTNDQGNTGSGGAKSDTDTVGIAVKSVNDAPVAQNDSHSTDEDTELTVSAPGVLGNDSDADGDSLTVTDNTSPAHGSVTVNANGSFTYTPNGNYHGSDSFDYTVSDGKGGTATGTVNLTVTAVNDAPTCEDVSLETDEDTQGSVAADCTDVDGDSLTHEIVDQAADGTASVDGSDLKYAPNANFHGSDEFTYRASDGTANSAAANVDVTVTAVNDAPDAVNDSDTTDEDTAKNIAVLANDEDVDGDALMPVIVTGPAHGTVDVITSGNDKGKVRYTPEADYNGSDSFTYKATDGTADSNVATVSITVKAVNDAPVAKDDTKSTNEDEELTFPSSDLVGNDDEGAANESGQTLTVTEVFDGTHGTVNLASEGGNITFKPEANFNGDATFEYRVCDDGDPSECSVETATVKVIVSAVNDAPSFTKGDNETVNEDAAAQTVNGWATAISAGPANESGQNLTFEITNNTNTDLFSDQPSVASDGTLSYALAANANGSADVTVRLKDDGGTANGGEDTSAGQTFKITVIAVNDDPTVKTAAPDDKGKNEGALLSTEGAFEDIDNDTLTITKTDGAGAVVDNGNGTWSWSLQTDDNISGSVTVTANDGKGGTVTDSFDYSTVNVDPKATFEAPEQVDEGSAINLSLTNPVDPGSADTFEYAFDCGDGNGYGDFGASDAASCPTTDDGERNVGAKIRDKDGGVSEYTASVTVNNVKPAVEAAADQSSDEGENKEFDFGSFTDPGDDGDWKVTVDWGDGSANTTFESGTGSLGRKAHAYADNGSYTVTVTVAEEGTGNTPSGSDTFKVTVANVAPTTTLSADNDLNVNEDTNGSETYNFSVSDPGDDTIDSIETSCGDNGTKLSETSTSVTCRFPDGPNTSVVSAQATDSDDAAGNKAEQTVEIANVKPSVVLRGDATANEGDTKTYTYTVTDPGDDTYTADEACGPNGNKTDTPAPDSFDCTFPDGPATTNVTVKVTDSDGATDTDDQKVTVTVSNVAPTATFNKPAEVDEGSAINLSLTNPVDPGSADTFEYAFDCGDGNGYGDFGASDAASCPTTDDGERNVGAKIRDKDGGVSEYTASVTVNNVAPTAKLNAPAEVDEGSNIGLSLIDKADPGSNDTFEYAFDCDLDDATGYGAFGAQDSASCSTDDDGTRRVGAKIRDDDGGENTYTTEVTIKNVAPVVTAAADQASDEGEDKSFGLGSFTDPGKDGPWQVSVDWGDGSNDNFTKASAGALGSLNHAYADNGTYTVTVKVSEAGEGQQPSDQKTFEVAVANVNPTAVNDNPAAVAEGGEVTLNVLANDTDPAGSNDPLSVTGKSDGAHGTVACQTDGSCTYTPNNRDFFGADSFTYTVSDGDGGSHGGTVNVEIYEVNDAPLGKDDAKTTPENQPISFPASDLVGNDDEGAANEGNQNLTVTEVGAAERGQVELNGGQITFTPDADYNGQASFKYTVCDDGTTNGQPDPKCEVLTAIVNVTISPVNSKPEANDGTAQMDEDAAPISIDLGALVSDKETADADLTYNIVQGPTAAQGELTGSGPTFSFDSARDYFGTFDILYTVTDRGDPDDCSAAPCDAKETSDQKKVTVTVNAVNDAPVAVPDSEATDEDTAVNINVLANDTDVDNAKADLNVTQMSDPAHGTLVLNANGSFTYTPNTNYHGPDSFTYKVDDGKLDSNVATVNINVRSVNDNPKIGSASGPLSVNEGDTKNYSVDASDADGDSLTYKWRVVSGPAVISGTDSQSSADVAFRDNGTVVLEAKVSDGKGGTDIKEFSIAAANVAPTVTRIDASSTNVLAGTANSVTFTGTATDPSSIDLSQGFRWQWALGSGSYTDFGAINANTYKTSFTGCGPQTVSAIAKDKDGGVSAPFTTSYSVNAYTGAYKAPLVDGTINKVQKGQVVPVKISIGCGTTNLTGLSPHIQLLTGNNSPENESGSTAITTSVSSADTGQTMRPVDGGYIYNLRVPDGTVGTQYTIRVNPFGATANHQASGMYIVLEIRK